VPLTAEFARRGTVAEVNERQEPGVHRIFVRAPRFSGHLLVKGLFVEKTPEVPDQGALGVGSSERLSITLSTIPKSRAMSAVRNLSRSSASSIAL
jgi:hypothetical protein